MAPIDGRWEKESLKVGVDQKKLTQVELSTNLGPLKALPGAAVQG